MCQGEGVSVCVGVTVLHLSCHFLSVQTGATVVSVVGVQRHQVCGSRGARDVSVGKASGDSLGSPVVSVQRCQWCECSSGAGV